MNRNELLEKMTRIFRDVFDDESIEINENTNADDIEGWDSLSHITLIFEIEATFDCKFSMADLQHMKDVKAMLDRISAVVDKGKQQ
jgi:acyl carrier protein